MFRIFKIDNEILNFFYQKYSKTIPLIGKYIVGDIQPYKYLVSSINQFYNQNELLELMISNGFSNTEYRNLSLALQLFILDGKFKCLKEFLNYFK